MKYIFGFFIICPLLAFSEEIQLPDEALAQETVTPRFDETIAVNERYISKTKKMEGGVSFGTFLRDPFYTVYPVEGSLIYHINEIHSLGVVGAYALTSLKEQGTQIQSQTTLVLNNVPKPTYYGFLQYELTPYYGKISVSKSINYNLDLSFLLGVGYIGLQTESGLAFEAGLNQRIYLTKKFGIKPELKLLYYQQKDPVFVTPKTNSVMNLSASLGLVFIF